MATSAFFHIFKSCLFTIRKKFLLVSVACVIAMLVAFTITTHLPREEKMERRIADLQTHFQFLESQYRARLEDIINLQEKKKEHTVSQVTSSNGIVTTTMSTVVQAMLRNLTGTRAAAGILHSNLQALRLPFIYQLLPHLMNDHNSMRPAYHMHGGRLFADVVIGIPSVKRDKETYLILTLTHLIGGLREEDFNKTLIVVFIGETDLEYVMNTARQIEVRFPNHVESGMIEVISPSPSYYPDLDSLPLSLGDSLKRVKWRTKQNLDTIYLMAYSQSKGTYYLMLEDDIIAKKNYMREIKDFAAVTTVAVPNWFFIEFCQTGGIGKLFKSSNIIHFITYVQLFYANMPIDWLLESYLADRVCTIDKASIPCQKSKATIRPKYKNSLFQHIGLYSSLKGKIQKVKDPKFGTLPTFYPHKNPPADSVRTSIIEQSGHTLKKAYAGETYFWGAAPKQGDFLEILFENPIKLASYTFRSGNVDHISDRFYSTNVEVWPADKDNFTVVGTFDEFGLAESELSKDLGPLIGIRLVVNKDSTYWIILSEIELKTVEDSI